MTKATMFATITVTVLILSLVALTGAGSSVTRQQESLATHSNAYYRMPLPVETYVPPNSLPQPTPVPVTPAPLPPPPPAISLPPTSGRANIAWSTAAESGMAVWVGYYSETPLPGIIDARQVARWNQVEQPGYVRTELRLVNMAVSPNGRYLAALAEVACIPLPPEPTATPGGDPSIPGVPNTDGPCMGDWPRYLYVIDLATNKVQSVPDYYSHNQLYEEYTGGTYFSKILGWFDNERFGIALRNNEMVAATRNGASIAVRAWPADHPYYTIFEIALLPDHKTIFAWVDGEFFFREAATGTVRRAGNWIEGEGYDYIAPSPDGKYIVYLKPHPALEGYDFRDPGLWVQTLASDARNLIIDRGAWHIQPAWSPDSSQIAFVHTQVVPPDYGWTGDPQEAETNIYLASVGDFKPHQLTNFTGVRNSGILWTPGGNLILSSTVGSKSRVPGIVAVSTKDGTAKVLVSGAQSESLVGPVLFGDAMVPGMPHVGTGDARP